MPIVALSGLRGGVGTTSVTAALAWALNRLGERTIAVDFSPHNQLCTHFNTPLTHARGWAHSAQLDFIPFGQLHSVKTRSVICASLKHCWPPGPLTSTTCVALTAGCCWISRRICRKSVNRCCPTPTTIWW